MGFPGGDWAIISIDGTVTRAKIVHKSRGRYAIVRIQNMADTLTE